VQVRIATWQEAAHAIATMQVRGAPLIGAVAAYGVALAATADPADAAIQSATQHLCATRPTAVNLQWAVARVLAVIQPLSSEQRAAAAWSEARRIVAEDVAATRAIGEHGLATLRADRGPQAPLRILTHCNAGRLATCGVGTALAPVYAAQRAGQPVHVWVSETRPRNQGLLTCWELADAGVDHTLIADNAPGLLLMRHRVDAVIVGADRIAANGDTANKIGTYLKALAARAHGVPFFVAAPLSTIDFNCPAGAQIPIEERERSEFGATTDFVESVANPAFDVTPAHLITGIISERGVLAPTQIEAWRS
jgi:methylthioribose-1-phosphate isomerase